MEDRFTTLRQWISGGMTAERGVGFAMDALGDAIAYGFVYTPGSASIIIKKRGQAALVDCSGDRDLDPDFLAQAFELRLFGDSCEARWERLRGAEGRLIIASDEAVTSGGQPRNLGEPAPARRVRWRDHCYLLWGEAAGGETGAGRTKLTTSRIGALWAPIDSDGKRVALTAREYFETRDYGNVVFIGERLTSFRAAADDDANLGAGRDQFS